MNSDGYFQECDFEKSASWRRALDLAYASWRVADGVIADEFLREKIKRFSADILVAYPNALAGSAEARDECLEKIRAQLALLSLAQKISDMREINFMILKNEYKMIAVALPRRGSVLSAAAPSVSSPPAAVTPEPSARDVTPEEQAPLAQKIARPEKKNAVDITAALNERQQKILQFFNRRKDEKIKLKEVMQFFPSFTDRTIRNDLRDLCVKKIVKRSDGHGQGSYYVLAKR